MISSGFVNIIKPTGMTSSDVVCKVKKILNIKKVGHLGTLDPAASGVLPIAIGKATKFFDYFLKKDKEYYAIANFGVLTDTLDAFGKIIEKKESNVSLESLKEATKQFIGKQQQMPPKFSAIKIGGEKACDLARKGQDFEIKSREIEIFDISVMDQIDKNNFLLKIHCSAGTYIRTLINDIAKKLKTVATTTVIIRTKSGLFNINDSITLSELENNKEIIQIENLFDKMQKINVGEDIAKKLLNGVKVSGDNFCIKGENFFVVYDNRLIGLYSIQNNFLNCDVYLWSE